MTVLALARKWRPRTFSELLGQEHINKTLKYSLDKLRLHHAYLFTGTRGIGKTSIARILAKALNCEQGISATPCLNCATCKAIEANSLIDLIEVDGASRTRVEDTRDLLENIQYAPSFARFKIYLIDEVHMLSQHSFNALLKTLEEPPPHVKFIFATTEPQKLPLTILSRCLQFNLKLLNPQIISEHLEKILISESLIYEPKALDLIAKAAKGSMRDALSLLDQIIPACGPALDLSTVKHSLGHTQKDYAIAILTALGAQDAETLIQISQEIAHEGGQFCFVLEDLIVHIHQLTLKKVLAADASFLEKNSALDALIAAFSAEDLQLFYQIAVKGLHEIHLPPNLAIAFEMTLLRMHTFRLESTPPVSPPAWQNTAKIASAPLNLETPLPQTSPPEIPPSPQIILTQAPLPQVKSHSEKQSAACLNWSEIISSLNLQGLTLHAAEQVIWAKKESGVVILGSKKSNQFAFTETVRNRIALALKAYFKEPIKLVIESDEQALPSIADEKKAQELAKVAEKTRALKEDPVLQNIQDSFDAEWVE